MKLPYTNDKIQKYHMGTSVILIMGTGAIGTKIMTNSNSPWSGNKRREREREKLAIYFLFERLVEERGKEKKKSFK